MNFAGMCREVMAGITKKMQRFLDKEEIEMYSVSKPETESSDSTVCEAPADTETVTQAMKDIKLPGPESRIVVFAGTVFKLKYKLRSVAG